MFLTNFSEWIATCKAARVTAAKGRWCYTAHITDQLWGSVTWGPVFLGLSKRTKIRNLSEGGNWGLRKWR